MAGSCGRDSRHSRTEAPLPKDPNAIRWNGRPGHYEVWYATLVLPSRGQALWLRYTLDASRSGEVQPALWASFFDRARPERNFAVREPHAPDALRRTEGALVVGVGPHELRRNTLKGRAAGGGHEVAWDLRFAPADRGVEIVPAGLRPVQALVGSGVVFANQDVRFDGEVTVDGERIAVAGAPAEQTHLWGRKRKLYSWSHCNAFANADASFDGFAVRVAGRLINLYYLRHGGRVYGFNTGFRWAAARSEAAFPEWRFRARDGDVKLEGVARARPGDMVQVTYGDPDGAAFYCVNTELADLELRLRGPGAAETVLRAEGTATLEFTSREPNPAVKRWV